MIATGVAAAAAPRTPFGEILRRAVEATPGAIGGAFADIDGEMVDNYTTWQPEPWAILTAHYGIMLRHIHAAFGTWHHGSPSWFIAQHAHLDIMVAAVDSGYYALLALADPRPLAIAIDTLAIACAALRKEMA